VVARESRDAGAAGLVLALDRGGSCSGMAFRLAAEGAEPHLEVLWRREMAMNSYRVAVAALHARGWPPRGRAGLCDATRSAYLHRQAARSDRAPRVHVRDRPVRTTLDYVSRTVTALRECGMPDRALGSAFAALPGR